MTRDEQRAEEGATRVASVVLTLADLKATTEEKQDALRRLVAWAENDGDMFTILWTLTWSAGRAFKHKHGLSDEGFGGIRFVHMDDPNLEITDADAVPPMIALLGRWVTAAVANDLDNGHALFLAVPETKEAIGEFTRSVLQISAQMIQSASAA